MEHAGGEKAMKKILVINLGWEQEPLLDLIDNQNFEIYGIHNHSNYYKKPRYRDILIADFRDLSRLMQYAEKICPDAVISDQCDYSQFAQAVISEKFRLPGPRIAEAHIGCNKYLQRLRCKKTGVRSPDFALCFCVDDVSSFAKNKGFPVIVKPVDNRGSYGVNRVDTLEQCADAYFDALVNSHSRYVIVEEYITGTHITVDGYVFKIFGPCALAIASKEKLKQKHSIIDGEITYPAMVSERDYEALKNNFVDIAQKFGFSFGFLHGEFILTPEGDVYLTEIANRGGGVWTSEIIVPNVSGIDMNSVYLNDCLGDDFSPQNLFSTRIDKKPTIMKFFSFSDLQNGIIKSITGIDVLESRPNVLRLKMLVCKGDVIKAIEGGGDRHGVIIMTGENVDALRDELHQAVQTLRIEVE